jgi:protein-S-isoprenylcysteine O-methyltransferase Ste14
MKKREIIKHIKGYAIGLLVFIIFIPALIYSISQITAPLFKIPIFTFNFINYIIAIPLLIVGVIFAIWSNIDLFRIGKGGPTDIFNIAISPRTKKLVISGPYRYTRNPMVFGMNSIYFAIAVYLNSLISLIFVILFLSVIIIYLRLAEEKRLFKDFGIEYLEYKRNVSMIIPFLSKKTNNI